MAWNVRRTDPTARLYGVRKITLRRPKDPGGQDRRSVSSSLSDASAKSIREPTVSFRGKSWLTEDWISGEFMSTHSVGARANDTVSSNTTPVSDVYRRGVSSRGTTDVLELSGPDTWIQGATLVRGLSREHAGAPASSYAVGPRRAIRDNSYAARGRRAKTDSSFAVSPRRAKTDDAYGDNAYAVGAARARADDAYADNAYAVGAARAKTLVTAHRAMAVFYVVAGMVVLYMLQEAAWPEIGAPRGTLSETLWTLLSLCWLAPVLPGAIGFVGTLWFKHNEALDEVGPIKTLVSFRIVSRGTNTNALISTIRRCQAEMAKTPLFPFIIEVIIDVELVGKPEPSDTLRYIVVPPDYQTERRSLFKARALQYAIDHSLLSDDAWIVHLDEETQPTKTGIQGIAKMIQEEEGSGAHRIGQGCILYHRSWMRHPFLTLADMIRTGDDFARFHFQHKMGVTIFGLHGSYIVVRNNVEKSVGFDFGPEGSITEDAFWALKAMERGRRARWVDGYLEEQSTQSLNDFIKQRRRWFQGLVKVVQHAPVKLRWRICLGINTFLWALAPFTLLYTIVHLFFGSQTDETVRLLANFGFAMFVSLYLMGLHANMSEHGITHPWRKLGWWSGTMLAIPAFSVLEGLGVLSAFFKPASGFHIVKK